MRWRAFLKFTCDVSDYDRVKLFRLHCTICDRHLGCAPWFTERKMRNHKIFNVAVCRKCFEFFGDINFPIEDGSEIYCCWCGEGGEVFCCSKCPKVVCKVISLLYNTTFLCLLIRDKLLVVVVGNKRRVIEHLY